METDQQWLNSNDFSTNNFSSITQNRSESKGGGVAIITSNKCKTTQISKGDKETFQWVSTRVQAGAKQMSVTCIYHPPFGSNRLNTPTKFFDEITDFMTDQLSNNQNNIILGDFNIHINDFTNIDVNICNDTMMALGLDQHVTTSTHVSGNILDLVFTDIDITDSVVSTKTDAFFSDHRAVICNMNITKPRHKVERKTIRKFSNITPEQFITEFNQPAISDSDTLHETIGKLNGELEKVLNTLAPERIKTVSSKKTSAMVQHIYHGTTSSSKEA